MPTTAITLYDDRFARRQMTLRTPWRVVTFDRGNPTVIVDGQIRVIVDVSNTLLMPGDAGGPARVRWLDETRWPNQGYVCWGCPHFGISMDKYQEGYCCHPLYLGCFGCPQSAGNQRTGYHAGPDCPMQGKRSGRAQRRYRWRIKSEDIFWRYYHDSKRNPYREGFVPFVDYRPREPRIIASS